MKKLYWFLSKQYQNKLKDANIKFQFRGDEVWVNENDFTEAKKVIGI